MLNAELQLTEHGKNHLLRAQAGERLVMTKVVMSDDDNDIPGSEITNIDNAVITVNAIDYKIDRAKMTMRIDYSNAGLTEPFYFRIGAVYSAIEDDDGNLTDEGIYMAGNAMNMPSILYPAPVGSVAVVYFWDINVTIHNASNVTVVLDQGVAYVRVVDKATYEDIKNGDPNKWVSAEGMNYAIEASGGYTVISPFEIKPEDWLNDLTHPDNAELVWHADVSESDMSYNHHGDFNFDFKSVPAANAAGILGAESYNGYIRVWAKRKPTETLTGEYGGYAKGRKTPTPINPIAGAAVAGRDIIDQSELRRY